MVHTRNAATLLPIVQTHVAAGSIVHTDQWRAYNGVTTTVTGSTHHTVNHSLTFVDPVTGVHTQNIESYWNRVKVKLKRMKGCASHQIPSYLDEFMWFETTPQQAWINIMTDIAHQYPV